MPEIECSEEEKKCPLTNVDEDRCEKPKGKALIFIKPLRSDNQIGYQVCPIT